MSSDVIILDNEPNSRKSNTQVPETILLDDYKCQDDDLIIQDNLLYDGQNKTNLYDQLIKEDKQFVELIDKCLELENTIEMRKVVNKTLLNAHQRASKEYLKSEKYKKLLLRTIALLDTDPDKKFQHIKYFYEALLLQKLNRKRVELITLQTNPKRKCLKKLKQNEKRRKKPSQNLLEVFEIDSDSDVGEAIHVEEDQNDVEFVGELENVQNEKKENNKSNIVSESPYKGTIDQPLLAPHKEIDYFPAAPEDNTKRITEIEASINEFNIRIQHMEEMEVTDDTETGSPYLICERLKGDVVRLYKELCTLKGMEAFKKSRVHIDFTEGHPRGPTKLLEDFLNDREENMPQFPDFTDVVTCVLHGIKQDGLSWSKQQIMKEAKSLFIQCGRALQKHRQRREWKDLMCRVKKEEMPDEDPADRDPVLLAKLQENRKVAEKKEREILERYSAMEKSSNSAKASVPSSINAVIDDDEPSSEDEDDLNYNRAENNSLNNQTVKTIVSDKIETNKGEVQNESVNNNGKDSNDFISNCCLGQIKTESGIKAKVAEDITSVLDSLGSDYIVSIIDIEDPFLVIDISSDSSDDESAVENEGNS